MNITETSIVLTDEGGASEARTVTASSAQSAKSYPTGKAVVYATVDCYVRAGGNPTALATGVDQFIPAGRLLRLEFAPGSKLAFIRAGSTDGTAYITPAA